MLETQQPSTAEDKKMNNPVRPKLEVNQFFCGPESLYLEKDLNCLEALAAVAGLRDGVVTSAYGKWEIMS